MRSSLALSPGAIVITSPIFVDTNLLIHALERGHGGALTEIRSRQTLLAPNQLHEFFNVRSPAQRAARRRFLRQEGMQSYSGPIAGQIARSRVFQDVFRQVVGQQGRADAALAAFAKATGFEMVTMERRLYNFLTNTLRKLQIPVRRIV